MKRQIYSAITRWVSWTRLFISMQIIDNISVCWKSERERRIKRRTYTRTISQTFYSRTIIEIFRETERDTRIKRCTYTPTMSDKIGWHCYTHLETHREKDYHSRDIRIHVELPIIYQTLRQTDGQKEREKRRSRHVPIHVQSVTI